jgi:hypothetical protein
MNAKQIIDGIRDYRDAHFSDDDPMRLEYQITCLETKIMELCFIYNNVAEELRNLQRELNRAH